MKSIEIKLNEIIVTYKNSDKAEKIYNSLYDYEQERCSVDGVKLIYHIRIGNEKYLYTILIDLLINSVFGTDVHYEKFDGDLNDLYSSRVNCFLPNRSKLFKVTPVNVDGAFGTLDFGVCQYTDFISFILVNRTGEFVVLTDRCHVGDYDGHHQIGFDGNVCSILIEVGDVIF